MSQSMWTGQMSRKWEMTVTQLRGGKWQAPSHHPGGVHCPALLFRTYRKIKKKGVVWRNRFTIARTSPASDSRSRGTGIVTPWEGIEGGLTLI